MDCVRVSTKEFDDEYHNSGNYKELTQIKGADECRQVCVSDLDCKAWKYTDGNCYISENNPAGVSYKKGARSGIVLCERTFSMVHLILLVFLFGLILVGVFWFMNTDKKFVIPKITLKGKKKYIR